jgi:hypothetical protein
LIIADLPLHSRDDRDSVAAVEWATL